MYWIYRIFKDARVSVNVVTLHYSSNPIVGYSLCRTSREPIGTEKEADNLTRMPSCYLERNSCSMYRQRATFLMGARLRRERLEERNCPLARLEVCRGAGLHEPLS